MSVVVVLSLERAEEGLREGVMRCPRCQGRLRPYGHARTRTVRGLGTSRLRVTPRRARCADCRGTHVLLPGKMLLRRADATEVIGHALTAKAISGAGHRSIAARLDRPASTVRRWLRRTPEPHVEWLHQQAVQRCARIDPELLAETAFAPPAPSPLAAALNLLAGAALRYRERVGVTEPAWAVIGAFSCGRLLSPPMIM